MARNARSSGRPGAWPVLYLDLDDTLVARVDGQPRAALGAREFLLWALETFEVRWLTTWCPSGSMDSSLLRDLCRMLEIEPADLHDVRGFDWESTGSKLNGIAWLEHLVLGRPFIWLEDEYGVGDRELSMLREAGLENSYRHCNVSTDPESLARIHDELYHRYADSRSSV